MYNNIMDIKKMTKKELIKNIESAQRLLDNKTWIRKQSKFWIGVHVVHLGKLNDELTRRENSEK